MVYENESTFVVLLEGLSASLIMIGCLLAFQTLVFHGPSFIRTVGAIFTQTSKQSLHAGLLAYLLYGMVCAFLYHQFFISVPHDNALQDAELGAFFGLMHGLVVGLLLIIFVKEHHPIKKWRIRGFSTSVSNIFSHVIYGMSLGLIRDWVIAFA